jgi:hypothetical protein
VYRFEISIVFVWHCLRSQAVGHAVLSAEALAKADGLAGQTSGLAYSWAR